MHETVQKFLRFLAEEKNYTENTIAAYRNDLTQFVTRIQDEVAGDWTAVDRNVLDNYIEFLKTNRDYDYSSSTIARKVAALKSFFHYLIAEGIIQNDPTATIDSPKVKKRLPQAISVEDINKLLKVTTNNDAPKSRRDHAMLELLYASGMRVTELVSLNVEDIDFEEGTVRVRGKKSGIKERHIPLSGEALAALRLYVEQSRQQLLRNPKETALFLNHRGQRLTRQGAWLIIKRYVQEVGISAKVTPHTLRHSFAAHKLSLGKSLQDIQKLLGHANISTTQVYTHLAKDEE
ncbi:MAG: tyrosine recombinase [Caldilineae bacterium]|nr:MAG: tyrosine recombinase [Caldilineae bacterium]